MFKWNKRKKITKLITILVSAELIVFAWLCSPFAYLRGVLGAYYDHRHGRYEYMIYGLGFSDLETDQLLRERYGVKLNRVAGCFVSDGLVKYVKGYNCISERLNKKRFHKDIYAECIEDARKIQANSNHTASDSLKNTPL